MVMKIKNYARLTALLIVLATSSQATADNSTKESADLIITGARIFTSDKQQSWAEALAIKDGKFVYVGDANGIVAYTSTNSIDLNGKLVIPGMVDGHGLPRHN
jgi:adenine deaminase